MANKYINLFILILIVTWLSKLATYYILVRTSNKLLLKKLQTLVFIFNSGPKRNLSNTFL